MATFTYIHAHIIYIIYIHTCTCIHTYIHAYIYIYTYTHKQTILLQVWRREGLQPPQNLVPDIVHQDFHKCVYIIYYSYCKNII